MCSGFGIKTKRQMIGELEICVIKLFLSAKEKEPAEGIIVISQTREAKETFPSWSNHHQSLGEKQIVTPRLCPQPTDKTASRIQLSIN
jgi:hypothetical protein